MFVTNPKDGPMLQLKLPNVIPFPLVLYPGHTEKVSDDAHEAIAPFAQQFGLQITKSKPKNCTMQSDYEAPEEVTDELPTQEDEGDMLDEPAPETNANDKPLNEPAPTEKEKNEKLNEPAPRKRRHKIVVK